MKNFLLLFLLLPAFAFGQDSISYVPLEVAPKPVVTTQSPVFKLAPLSLIDLDPTVQAAVEIPLRPKWSIQQEIGYGWPTLGLLNYQRDLVKPKTTIRARTEIRYYFSPDLIRKAGLRPGPSGFYVASEALFKQMKYTENPPAPISLQTPFPVPAIVNEKARVTRNVYGMHAKVGYQAVVGGSKKSPSFVIDVYMGVGFKIISVRQTAGPPMDKAFSFVDNTGFLSYGIRSRFDPTPELLQRLSLSGGVKIGWMINSGKKIKKK